MAATTLPAMSHRLPVIAAVSLLAALAACSSEPDSSSSSTSTTSTIATGNTPAVDVPPSLDVPISVDVPATLDIPATVDVPVTVETSVTGDGVTPESTADSVGAPTGGSLSFTAEVWADNWFALYINGELVGQDSVPITTERSFNAETITFTADYPFTVGLLAKDFMESNSGLEYIGTDRQQMGDGGIIAQIVDDATGAVIAATGSNWEALVVQRAPLNKECEQSSDPNTECLSEAFEIPHDWATLAADTSAFTAAVEYTADQVGAKDGYDQISWDESARLIWGDDLETDNIILLRTILAR